jgi:hypothetical protein
MTGTNCDLFTHNQSRSYLNHLVLEQLILRGSFFVSVLTDDGLFRPKYFVKNYRTRNKYR